MNGELSLPSGMYAVEYRPTYPEYRKAELQNALLATAEVFINLPVAGTTGLSKITRSELFAQTRQMGISPSATDNAVMVHIEADRILAAGQGYKAPRGVGGSRLPSQGMRYIPPDTRPRRMASPPSAAELQRWVEACTLVAGEALRKWWKTEDENRIVGVKSGFAGRVDSRYFAHLGAPVPSVPQKPFLSAKIVEHPFTAAERDGPLDAEVVPPKSPKQNGRRPELTAKEIKKRIKLWRDFKAAEQRGSKKADFIRDRNYFELPNFKVAHKYLESCRTTFRRENAKAGQ